MLRPREDLYTIMKAARPCGSLTKRSGKGFLEWTHQVVNQPNLARKTVLADWLDLIVLITIPLSSDVTCCEICRPGGERSGVC